MEIRHNFGKNLSIEKTVASDASLMLAESGSYLWISKEPSSRYQGWFFESGRGLLKIIDDIKFKNAGPAAAIENNGWSVKRGSGDFLQTFFLAGSDCLVCEAGRTRELELFFDIKEPYKNPEYGRNYKVWREDSVFFVSYRQDGESPMPEIYVAVYGDITDARFEEKWIKREYAFDRGRDSVPWERWICMPLAVTASKIVIAVAKSKEEAGRAARDCWRNLEKIKKEKKKKCANGAAFGSGGEDALAKTCAQNALSMLVAPARPVFGLRAGLPWFFQFWQRDEAVCLPALLGNDPKLAETVFWRQMGELKAKGYDLETADGIGWLFSAAAGFAAKRKLDIEQTAIVADCLGNALGVLEKKYTVNSLAVCGGKPTWMDSLDRSGACIEIQTQRLGMYALAARLVPDEKAKERWLALEKSLAVSARLAFFDGHRLADRVDVSTGAPDFIARPNMFLAAYIYPDLLEKHEWAKVFEYALPRLWLDWGGLSTVDKSDSRFHGIDSGENPAAYHNGDSWFWINNIAAIVLARLDKKRFAGYIEKIYEASKNDILWNGVIGCASEISSAQNYEPVGCVNQAWSNATFLELCREIKK